MSRGAKAVLAGRVSADVRATRDASKKTDDALLINSCLCSVNPFFSALTSVESLWWPENAPFWPVIALVKYESKATLKPPVIFCNASAWWLPSTLAFALQRTPLILI